MAIDKGAWAQDIHIDPGALGEQEGKLSLREIVENNHIELSTCFNDYRKYPELKKILDRWRPDGIYSDFFKGIVGQIDDGQIDNGMIINWWHGYMFKTDECYPIVPLWLSCIYTILAHGADKNGESGKGWAWAAKACYYTGHSRLIIECEQFKMDASERQKKASQANLARDRTFEPVKREAITLLLTKAPKGGWKNKAAAINGIEKDLYQFIKKEGFKLAPSGINDTGALSEWLDKWIGLDLAMKDALLANMNKNNTETAIQ